MRRAVCHQEDGMIRLYASSAVAFLPLEEVHHYLIRLVFLTHVVHQRVASVTFLEALLERLCATRRVYSYSMPGTMLKLTIATPECSLPLLIDPEPVPESGTECLRFLLTRSMIIWLVKAIRTLPECVFDFFHYCINRFSWVSLNVVPKLVIRMASLFGIALHVAVFSYTRTPISEA